MALTSYHLKKTKDKTTLDKIWLSGRSLIPNITQVVLSSFELRKLRVHLKDKKLNCLTCNKMDLDFEEAYMNCFRDKNHSLEFITSNRHLLCYLFGVPVQRNFHGQLYKTWMYCKPCEKAFETNELRCMCCGKSLKRNPESNIKSKSRGKLLRH